MLNHALGMQNLRLESYRFIRLWLRHMRHRDDKTLLKSYPRPVKGAYTLYGLGSIAFGVVLACWFAYWLLTLVLDLLG
jgi:putative peptide zinc metalloprotease protein